MQFYILQELGIQLYFQHNIIEWQEIKIPKTPIDYKVKNHFAIQDRENISNETKRTKKILDANNKKDN